MLVCLLLPGILTVPARSEPPPAGSERAQPQSQSTQPGSNGSGANQLEEASNPPPGLLQRLRSWLGLAPEEGKLAWLAGGLGDRVTGPVLFEDLVLVAGTFVRASTGAPTMSVLSAISQSTGKVRWSQELGAVLPVTPVVLGDRVIIADDSGAVWALDGKTSRILWKIKLTSPVLRSPAVGEGLIAILAGSSLFALDPDSGAIRWQRAFPLASSNAGLECSASMEISPGLLIVYRFGELQVLEVADGSTRWSQALPAGCKEPLTVIKGMVVVGDGPKGLRAIRVEDGLERWRYAGELRLQGFRAALDGVLAVTSPDQQLVALDLESGKRLWKCEYALPLPPPLLALEQSLVFRSAPERLTVLNMRTGREVWSALLPPGLSYLPLASKDGRVFVPLAGGSLAAVDSAAAGT